MGRANGAGLVMGVGCPPRLQITTTSCQVNQELSPLARLSLSLKSSVGVAACHLYASIEASHLKMKDAEVPCGGPGRWAVTGVTRRGCEICYTARQRFQQTKVRVVVRKGASGFAACSQPEPLSATHEGSRSLRLGTLV